MQHGNQETLVDGLSLPNRLITLVQRGLWPVTEVDERRQLITSLVPKERIHLFAPEEEKLYLVRPPFRTLAKRLESSRNRFWSTYASLDTISPELSVLIGDFGLGSDAPILLDYREDRSNPVVIRLKWRKSPGHSNVWVRCATTFDEFADMLGLDLSRRQLT